MPLSALQAVSTARNGVGTYILQCKRLDFHYCDWAGSSRGMLSFIKNTLPRFAKQNPQIEIHVSPRPRKHPIIRGYYMNGKQRAVGCRNLEKDQILQKAEALRNTDGERERRVRKPVSSINESVRGVWSGLHGQKIVLGDEGKAFKQR